MSTDWTDTMQQKLALRRNPVAARVRKRFPAGTRVVVNGNVGQGRGVVLRHVPGHNAVGGYLVILLDTGVEARLSPTIVQPEEGA